VADVIREVHLRRAVGAEKLADQEPDVRVRDDSQSAARDVEQWAAQDAAPSEWELCTPDADRSAAQSCVVRVELVVVEPVGRHGSGELQAEVQYSAALE
jgi:hypothetical protein